MSKIVYLYVRPLFLHYFFHGLHQWPMLCLLTSNKFHQLYFFYVKSLLPMGLAYDLFILLLFIFSRESCDFILVLGQRSNGLFSWARENGRERAGYPPLATTAGAWYSYLDDTFAYLVSWLLLVFLWEILLIIRLIESKLQTDRLSLISTTSHGDGPNTSFSSGKPGHPLGGD